MSSCGADHLLSQRGGGSTQRPFPQAHQCLLGPSSHSRLSGLGVVGWWAGAGGQHCSGSLVLCVL